MASRTPGLQLENNTYIVRKVVPSDVRGSLGRRELIRSLQTGDYPTAVKAYGPVWREFNAIIEAARAANDSQSASRIDLAAIDGLLARWLIAEHAKPLPEFDDLTTPWHISNEIESYARAMADPTEWRSIPNIDAEVKTLMVSLGVDIQPAHRAFAEVRKLVIRSRKLLLEHREKERLARAWSKRSRTAPEAPPPEAAKVDKPLPAPSVTLQTLFDQWLPTLTVSEKEIGRLKHQNQRLIEFMGNKPANYVTKADVIDFMGLLPRFPGRKRPAHLNVLPIRALIERFEQECEESDDPPATLSKTTVGEWFAGYRRMFDHGVRAELIERNPFRGMNYLIRGAPSIRRRAFEDQEVRDLFSKPLFQGEGRGANFWLPILSLFHGSRLSELAALPKSAFRQTEAGDWFFDLTDQKVKTETSRRLIPLHPKMIELGFLTYVEGLIGEWLFPDLDHENPRGPGHEFSKWWGRWTSEVGFDDPALVFHSFRHTWKRRARSSDVKEEIHDVISGHKGAGVGRTYGSGLDIHDLTQAMARITFPAFPTVVALS